MNNAERKVFHFKFEEALSFVSRLHAEQVRKETDIPYISHLIGVAGLLLDHGGNSEEAIAALLHDSIEDQGSDYPGGTNALRKEIRKRFGAKVLEIVEGCTDSETNPKPPWRDRKEKYIAHIAKTSPSVCLVSCADKLHNARSVLSDLRIMGDALWPRFNGGKEGTLWYYRALVTAFRETRNTPLIDELDRVVTEIEALAK
ncbi:MAG: HD domain-containing protein [Gammaproteobacteria bacterium]|nr:HD domain-containing protein [Gammaproteobacteria bacterium]